MDETAAEPVQLNDVRAQPTDVAKEDGVDGERGT